MGHNPRSALRVYFCKISGVFGNCAIYVPHFEIICIPKTMLDTKLTIARTMDSEAKRKAALRQVLGAAPEGVARKGDLLKQAAPLAQEVPVAPPKPVAPSKSRDMIKKKAATIKGTIDKTLSQATAVKPRQFVAQDHAARRSQSVRKMNRNSPHKAPIPLQGPWVHLAHRELNDDVMRKHRIFMGDRSNAAYRDIDMLRTRLLSSLSENGWRRVAITSPTSHCGKTFVTANLALSLSRHDQCRAIVVDMDLRKPSLAQHMGIKNPGDLSQVFTGADAIESHLVTVDDRKNNIGANVAFALNDTAQTYAAELLMEPRTHAILDKMQERFDPDVVLYNLPPILEYDDMVGFKNQVDGILLVVSGGETRTNDIRKVHKIIGNDIPLLGVVLNRSEDIAQGWQDLRSSIRQKWRRVFK